jgi:hypothetical protein
MQAECSGGARAARHLHSDNVNAYLLVLALEILLNMNKSAAAYYNA